MCINSFHWILFIIVVNGGRMIVLDSLRYERKWYQPMIDVINRAWAIVEKEHVGVHVGDLDVVDTYPV